MNNRKPLNSEWITTWEHAMLIEEGKDIERFHDFYASIPELVIRHKTHESHLPLKLFVTNVRQEGR